MVKANFVSNFLSFQLICYIGFVLLHPAVAALALEVLEGDDVTLSCTNSGTVYPGWTGPDLNGNIVIYSYILGSAINPKLGEKINRLTWDPQNNKSLIIRNVIKNDSGLYTCQGLSDEREIYTVSVRVKSDVAVDYNLHTIRSITITVTEDKNTSQDEQTPNVALIVWALGSGATVIVCITVVVLVVLWKRRTTEHSRRNTSLNRNINRSHESVIPSIADLEMEPRQGDNLNIEPNTYEDLLVYNENTHEYESLSPGNQETTSSDVAYENLQSKA